MALRSAGLVLYRRSGGRIEVLLGHMGGPFYARRNQRAWTIPKGEPNEGEELIEAARREFAEELGVAVPQGSPTLLGEVRQSGGKVVTAWALEGDLDPAAIVGGKFELEWPKGSGQLVEFLELDRVEWCDIDELGERLIAAQETFIDRLRVLLS